MNIDCEQFEALLDDRVDNALDVQAKLAFDSHCRECESCRNEYEVAVTLDVRLRTAWADVSAPEQVRDICAGNEFEESIDAQSKFPASGNEAAEGNARRIAAVAIAIAASLLVLATVVSQLDKDGPSTRVTAISPDDQPDDVQQSVDVQQPDVDAQPDEHSETAVPQLIDSPLPLVRFSKIENALFVVENEQRDRSFTFVKTYPTSTGQ